MIPQTDAMIAFANEQLGDPYVFAARGPNRWDCIGLVVGAARHVGLTTDQVPNSWTVRNLTAWAKKHGYLRLAADGYQGQRGDIFLWGDAKSASHAPVLGAGHTGLVKQPISAKHPRGRAISAFNPELDVINHGIAPKPGSHLALYGFVVIPDKAAEPGPGPEDQLETPPPTDALEPVPVEPDEDLDAGDAQAAREQVLTIAGAAVQALASLDQLIARHPEVPAVPDGDGG